MKKDLEACINLQIIAIERMLLAVLALCEPEHREQIMKITRAIEALNVGE